MKKAFVLSFALAAIACHNMSVKEVPLKEYASLGECWKDDSGHVVGFIVFSKSPNQTVTPYMISYKCIEKNEGRYNPYTIINNLGSIQIDGDGGKWKRKGVLNREISTNAKDHPEFPSDQDKLYVFHGSFRKENLSKIPIYNIDKIYNLTEIQQTFKEFSYLSPEQRLDIWEANFRK